MWHLIGGYRPARERGCFRSCSGNARTVPDVSLIMTVTTAPAQRGLSSRSRSYSIRTVSQPRP